jgi:transposase InsO family protein
MQSGLVCEALRMAYWQHKPLPGLLLHSDRVANTPTSRRTGNYPHLSAWQLRRASRANARANAPMESFFKTLKVERIYPRAWHR